jgi:N-acyl-D-glutamate deacylase
MMRALLIAIGAAVLLGGQAQAQSYDLVIRGGLVMDPESGLEAVRNVAVHEGKIVAITQERLRGKQTIDAQGRVVAPGFIDIHSHSQNLVGSRVQAFDGVTTAFESEVGQLPIAMAYEKAAASGRAINHGYTVSWSLARMKVLGGATPDGTVQGISEALEKAASHAGDRASAQQLEQILALLEQGLDEGATGIGLALGYLPGATEEEVLAVSKLAARRGVAVFVHMRSTVGALAATEEVIANAAVTGAHWYIMHVYLDSREGIEAVELARRAGLRITPETLGWLSGSTYIDAPFLRADALRKAGRPASMILYYGRRVASYDELAQLQASDPKAHIVTLPAQDDESDPVRRAEIARRLKTPGWVLASDAMPWQQFPTAYLPEHTWPLPAKAWAHPRGAATYTRIIQKYVREWQLVGLMDVLRAGSLNPARELEASIPALRNKGRLQVGADADIIVFDPARIAATPSVEKPATLPSGMDYVIVNGVALIERGRMDPALLPGKQIRREQHACAQGSTGSACASF